MGSSFGRRLEASGSLSISLPHCGVVAEELPFPRAGSRFTRAFEDSCVWLARDAPKSVVSRLMRSDWATVGRMIERAVTEASAEGGEHSLAGLRRIRDRRGRLPQGPPHRFFDELGAERCALFEAVSADLALPGARRSACAPRTPVSAGEALDRLRRQEWQWLRWQDPRRAVWLRAPASIALGLSNARLEAMNSNPVSYTHLTLPTKRIV